jgi:aspartate kinase
LIASKHQWKEPVKFIVCKKDMFLVNISALTRHKISHQRLLFHPNFIVRIFEILAKNSITVDMIASSRASVSIVTSSPKNLYSAVVELSELGEAKVFRRKVLISIVGEGQKGKADVAGKILSALEKADINPNMISQGATKISTNLLVDNKDMHITLRTLHNLFFNNKNTSEN